MLRGRVAYAGDDHLVLDVGGVGYLVQCGARTLQRLPPGDAVVELRIITQVREDAITLYGFLDSAEQRWFRLLQNIQGVGARLALAVLSVLSVNEVARAINAQDKAPLTRANGVGPKLAGRIVAELKDRIGGLPTTAPVIKGAAKAAGPDVAGDTLSALVQLGYGRSEAYAAVATVQASLGEAATVEQMIRECLKELAP